jgi:hypothetical protein
MWRRRKLFEVTASRKKKEKESKEKDHQQHHKMKSACVFLS